MDIPQKTLVLGAQWGDEGKGKIVDLLSEQAQLVVRYQGGPNAGHTIVANGQTMVLHTIPSGILQANTQCLIGKGVVVSLDGLLAEIDSLQRNGIEVKGRLRISPHTHVILPSHVAVDIEREQAGQGVGSTGRGIGPTYEDKHARRGFQIADFFDLEAAKHKFFKIVAWHQKQLTSTIDIELTWKNLVEQYQKIRPFIEKTPYPIDTALRNNQKVIWEGAQGVMLDIDNGTYPYVTSSSTGPGGALNGSGWGGNFDAIFGICKAYTTRVGDGPFPSYIADLAVRNYIAEKGKEFGATTGRPRKCGWIDLVALRHAVKTTGIQGIFLTKIDILDHLSQVGLVTAYDANEEFEFSQFTTQQLTTVKPKIEYVPGWSVDTHTISTEKQVPEAMWLFLKKIQEYAEVRIVYLSTGPGRNQGFFLNNYG